MFQGNRKGAELGLLRERRMPYQIAAIPLAKREKGGLKHDVLQDTPSCHAYRVRARETAEQR